MILNETQAVATVADYLALAPYELRAMGAAATQDRCVPGVWYVAFDGQQYLAVEDAVEVSA